MLFFGVCWCNLDDSRRDKMNQLEVRNDWPVCPAVVSGRFSPPALWLTELKAAFGWLAFPLQKTKAKKHVDDCFLRKPRDLRVISVFVFLFDAA